MNVQHPEWETQCRVARMKTRVARLCKVGADCLAECPAAPSLRPHSHNSYSMRCLLASVADPRWSSEQCSGLGLQYHLGAQRGGLPWWAGRGCHEQTDAGAAGAAAQPRAGLSWRSPAPPPPGILPQPHPVAPPAEHHTCCRTSILQAVWWRSPCKILA